MRKEYIEPKLYVKEINLNQMICVSMPVTEGSASTTPDGDIMESKPVDGWDFSFDAE